MSDQTTKTRGRKINPTSARQVRLTRISQLKESGVIIKRGRTKSDKQKEVKVKEKVVKVKEKNNNVNVEPVVLSEGKNHKTVSHPTGKPITYIKNDVVQGKGNGFDENKFEDPTIIDIEGVDEIIDNSFIPNDKDLMDC
jgi:hypothetical protein